MKKILNSQVITTSGKKASAKLGFRFISFILIFLIGKVQT